jgi:hypothetical protein
MIKKFHIQIPLSWQASFDLLRKSGDDITSWQSMGADFESGHLMWRQTLWSLTGKAEIKAMLIKIEAEETSAVVEVHKPLQIWDPAGICNRVFGKLDRAVKENLKRIEGCIQ